VAEDPSLDNGAALAVPDLDETLEKAIHDAIEGGGKHLARIWRREARRAVRDHRKDRRGFERRLAHRWGKALDLYETFFLVAWEAGSDAW
jgi:hypothetical protein